ncbi:MAG: F0F1 ATP synthase subunit B, partial [Alphaproteobacteria bacterium]|nr:F0F1 ATP synthase subunit B [Alphaproteobacteria bacterium]
MKDIIDKLPADPAFWVAVSFTIFVLLAVWRGRKAITTMLDNNIANIKKELSQAEQLKKEAMALHEAAIKKLNEAQKLAADIVTSNHQDGERL